MLIKVLISSEVIFNLTGREFRRSITQHFFLIFDLQAAAKEFTSFVNNKGHLDEIKELNL